MIPINTELLDNYSNYVRFSIGFKMVGWHQFC